MALCRRASAIVALSDTAVALVAAFVVFSLVFAVGSEPNSGFSLLFVNLPIGLAQAAALQAAESAFDLAVQRYQAGLGNFLVVLSAESNVIAQRRASAELRARELASDIVLARALGGGHADAGPAPELATLGRRELH